MTDSGRGSRKWSADRWTIVSLTSLLVGNPIILFLLTENAWTTLFLFVLFFSALVALERQRSCRPWMHVYGLNALVLLSLMLHAETLFKCGFPEYHIENLYDLKSGYYFNKPHLRQNFQDKEFDVHYITNADGLRIGAGMNPEKRFHKADWLFIGDSFTQGAQVEFEDLYTTQLYRQFPDRIIINAGISGFGIAEELQYYLDEGHRYGANKVFLQLCNFNDFMQVGPKDMGFSDHLMNQSELARFLLYDIKFLQPGELPLGRWCEPFYPQEEENQLYNIFFKESSPEKQADINAVRHHLELFQKAVEAQGAELIVLLIPTKEQTRFTCLEEVVHAFDLSIADLDMDRPNRLMHQWSDSIGFQLVDLLDTYRFESQSPFFDYDEHLNSRGHWLTAQTLATQLDASKSPATLLSESLLGDRYPQRAQHPPHLTSYQSMRDGNMELFVTDSTLTTRRRLTNNNITESHPTLSPDQTQIAFTQGDAASLETQVVTMNLDGSNRIIHTAGDAEFGAIPSFSPDGNQLAYACWDRSEDGQYSSPNLCLLDLSSGEKSTLLEHEDELWRPVWTPDGEHLVYIKKYTGHFDLFQLDLVSGEQVQLTDTDYDEWDPSVSSDGRHVVYAGRKNGNWDLFVLDRDSLTSRQVTSTQGDEWDPTFSHRDERLLYAGDFGPFQGILEAPLISEP